MKKLAYIGSVIGMATMMWLVASHFIFNSEDSELFWANPIMFSEALLISDKTVNKAYVYLVFPSGEASNTFDEGLAHYVEHLAWLSAFGSQAAKKERHANAWTNQLSTGYWLDTPPGELREALDSLLSVAQPFSIDTKTALQERDIILREYDYRVLDSPLYRVLRQMDLSIYGNGVLARSVIGTPSVISNYSIDDARTLHLQTHVLSQATLLVYGGVDRRQFSAALQELPVEKKPDSTLPPPTLANIVPIEDDESIALPTQAEDIFLYRKLSSRPDCGGLAQCYMLTRIAENALASALPGGLAGPLRFENFIARSFEFDISLIQDKYAKINFTAYPDKGVSLAKLQASFEFALQTVLDNGIPQDTFARIQARLESRLDGVLEKNRPRYNRDLAVEQLKSGESVYSISEQLDALVKISSEDVNQFLKALSTAGRVVTRRVSSEEY